MIKGQFELLFYEKIRYNPRRDENINERDFLKVNDLSPGKDDISERSKSNNQKQKEKKNRKVRKERDKKQKKSERKRKEGKRKK